VFRVVLRVLGFAYVTYLAVSLLLVLPVLNTLPAWFVKENYGRQLASDIILFNPFTLALVARGLAMPELDGEPFAGLDRAEVNLSLESLWRPGVVFDKIRVEGLQVHVRQLDDDSFNFSDLLPPESEEPEEPTDGALPGITVQDLAFHATLIRLTDENREEPFTTYYEELAIAVQDLSTVIEDGKPYRIDAAGENGGRLSWQGTVSIPGQKSEGRLALNNLDLRTAWRFAEPWVQFELTDGRLDVQGDYALSWQEGFDYGLDNGELQVREIAIIPADPQALPDTGLGWNSFKVEGISVEGSRQHASVELVSLQGLTVEGWSEGATVSLAELFAFDTGDEPSEAPGEPPPEQGTGEEGPAWTAAVRSIQLGDSRVAWRSEFTDPPRLDVTPIEIRVDNLLWPLAEETAVSVKIGVNEVARAAIDGSLALAEGAGDINYQLEDLQLAWFNPNFPPELKATITQGSASTKGTVSLDEFAPVRITTDGDVSGFEGRIEDDEESFTRFESIRWEQLAVDLEQREVAMQQLSINSYSGRLHIRKDGTVNTQRVWQAEVGDKAEEVAAEIKQGDPWKVNVPTILVTDSEIDFMDESLPIQFRTVVQDLNGEVLNLSTAEGAEAKVDVRGSVDGYAPVALTGSTQPFLSPPDLDLILTFDGVDMALLTPYSGTYAGRAIERGLLNLHLEYKLENGKLQGDNSVVIDKLKLGESVDSDKALDLPLDLALALLTDANGVIDIAVPVSGDIDDPQFSLGQVITGAFINLITKAATAPFALLANLIGTEEDLQRVNIATGSAELDQAGKTRLDQLGKALAERPGLTLVILGRLNPKADLQRLQDRQLEAELAAENIPAKEIETKGSGWEKAIRARYLALPGAVEDATPRQQYDAVRDQVVVPASTLEKLLQDRAVAVKTYLVNEVGLAADRAVIEQVSAQDEANLFSGVELDVDT
jgi:hypothetical protein